MFSITGENRHEVFGLLLVAFGLLVGLSLTPPAWIEALAVENAGSDNLAGPVGEFIRGHIVFFLGWGGYLVPLLIVLWGINRFLAGSSAYPLRITALAFGGSLLYSVASSIMDTGGVECGWLAQTMSLWFTSMVGHFGSLLIIYSLGVILLIITTGIQIEPVVVRLIRLLSRMAHGVMTAISRIAASAIAWNVERIDRRKSELRDRMRKRLGEKPEMPAKKKKTVRDKKSVDRGRHRAAEVCEELPDEGAVTAPVAKVDGYTLPPLSLLQSPEKSVVGISDDEKKTLAGVLVEKLADFNIRSEVVDIVSGPVITMFEVKPAPGIKVSQIQNLADDLAMAMRAKKIRIVAPIPGKGAVGIEIPNYNPAMVLLREIVGSEAFRRSGSTLPLPLGRDIVGKPVVADLASMPHLLIAGATGSGKSVNIHCLVTGFLYHFSPEDLSLIMIDPKMLELGMYNGIPHLLVPVVTDPKEAVRTLKWAAHEMEERYSLLAAKGVRSLPEYNRRVAGGEGEGQNKLPLLVIIIDELADLILTMQHEVEEPLARLAQMARGVGIHLILATQRPSVDVITGMIKANFPSRISFRVATKTDSRTILDTNGAEKLLGKGDMLFMPGGSSNPVRIHGAFISQPELEAVVSFVREQLEVWKPENMAGAIADLDQCAEEMRTDVDERDELFNEAIKIVLRYGHGSTSLLQRRLKIGYTRAARIVDQLEAAAIVGPPEGSKAREIKIDESYLKEKGIK